jgi:hypothetical protein
MHQDIARDVDRRISGSLRLTIEAGHLFARGHWAHAQDLHPGPARTKAAACGRFWHQLAFAARLQDLVEEHFDQLPGVTLQACQQQILALERGINDPLADLGIRTVADALPPRHLLPARIPHEVEELFAGRQSNQSKQSSQGQTLEPKHRA